MASTKEQMLKARELIKAKRYKEARAILKKINHPTAKEWLARIDGMSSSQKSSKGKASSSSEESGGIGGLLLRFMVLVVIIALIVVAYVVFSGTGSDDGGDNNTAASAPTNEADSPGLPPGLGNSGTDGGSNLPPFAQPDNGGTTTNGVPPFGNVGAPPFGSAITINDPLGATITLELLDGWSQLTSGLGILSHQTYGESIVVVNAVPSEMVNMNLPLQELAVALAGETDQVSFRSWNVNGVDIIQTTVIADNGEQSEFYYVESNGSVVVLVVTPEAGQNEEMLNDVLDMAATASVG